MSRSFGLDAPSALEDLRKSIERFKDDDLNRDLAREISIKAWHLCDHVYRALSSNSSFATVGELQSQVRNSCPELAYLQEICTESKHAEITKWTPQVDEARRHEGDFCREDFDHRDFDVSRLEVKLVSGSVIDFDDVINRAMDYWSQFFKDYEIK